MRYVSVGLLVLIAGLAYPQRIKATFGILEGNPPSYPNSGLFYHWEDVNTQGLASFAGGIQIEPYGNDLAYDPKTKLLFIIGGGPNAFTWNGSVYALDVWRSIVPLSMHLENIGARRLAVRDTLLLVTRNRAPYFTAYRISYNPQTNTLALDSLWSPTSPLLRNVPDGLLLWGDTAFVTISYDAFSYASDSLVVGINLQTRQVFASWEVFPNPAELVRIKDSLYVACYGNFGDNLHIARIIPSQLTVQVWDAGYQSFGGFTTDTSGERDTILFWASDGTLRAFDVKTGQTAPTPYLGLASSGAPFFSYGLLWVGKQIWMSFTNYTDTSLIVLRDPDHEPTPPHLDTMFVYNGFGGLGYPSLRRFIYVEDDTVRSTTSALPIALTPQTSVFYEARTGYLTWRNMPKSGGITVCNAMGQIVRRSEIAASSLYIGDLPSGIYIVTALDAGERPIAYRFWKP